MLHLDWWTSWGIWEPDEDLVELAKQMDLEQTREEIMKKTKEATTSRLDLKYEGMVFLMLFYKEWKLHTYYM